jgi:DNA-binding CsgD family transcriptional regulator
MQAPNFTPSPSNRDASTVLEDLTRQEMKILSFIAQGLTCQEIAEELSISILTVKTHKQNIARKADIKGASAIRKFVRAIAVYLKNTPFILL